MTLGEFRSETGHLDDSVELRMMTQQNYPHENKVCGVVDDQAIADAEGDEVDEAPKVLYVVEGSWVGYGSRRAWGE